MAHQSIHSFAVAVAFAAIGCAASIEQAPLMAAPRAQQAQQAAHVQPARARVSQPVRVAVRPQTMVDTRSSDALGVIVQGRAALPNGGRMVALGAPLREPKRVMLEVHTQQRAALGECQASMFRDGESLPVAQANGTGDYELRLIVDVAGLEGAQSSAHIAADACGVSFELDAQAREMLGTFAARFHEEASKGDAS